MFEKMQQLMELAAAKMKLYPDLRYGQALVNALCHVDLDAYCDLTCNASLETDCFYDDKKASNLLHALVVRWSQQ